MAIRIYTLEQLHEHLVEILANGPLYRTFTYFQSGVHKKAVGGTNYSILPERLRMFCDNEHCEQETWWSTQVAPFHFGSSFINSCQYECRNCGINRACYYFIWLEQEHEMSTIFLKVGQYPEFQERVPEALAKALDSTDLRLYEKALRTRNFNLGLAAVAYMRRVVENKMSEMLEILYDAAVAQNASRELLARHKEMRIERRFSAKVDYACDLLPANLRPPGKPNPMAILHELTSASIHKKSDEECANIFDKCRVTFEYVFAKIRIETEEAKNFVRDDGSFNSGKGQSSRS